MVMEADHSSICKFDFNLGPFGTVISALKDVFTEISNSSINDAGERNRVRTTFQITFLNQNLTIHSVNFRSLATLASLLTHTRQIEVTGGKVTRLMR